MAEWDRPPPTSLPVATSQILGAVKDSGSYNRSPVVEEGFDPQNIAIVRQRFGARLSRLGVPDTRVPVVAASRDGLPVRAEGHVIHKIEMLDWTEPPYGEAGSRRPTVEDRMNGCLPPAASTFPLGLRRMIHVTPGSRNSRPIA